VLRGGGVPPALLLAPGPRASCGLLLRVGARLDRGEPRPDAFLSGHGAPLRMLAQQVGGWRRGGRGRADRDFCT
jgi:hypothetical protein